ncbi:MAG: hypothetical protein LBB81_09665 [Treponema sp.]|nr:hypothetical protein [Treponema sp.]
MEERLYGGNFFPHHFVNEPGGGVAVSGRPGQKVTDRHIRQPRMLIFKKSASEQLIDCFGANKNCFKVIKNYLKSN